MKAMETEERKSVSERKRGIHGVGLSTQEGNMPAVSKVIMKCQL